MLDAYVRELISESRERAFRINTLHFHPVAYLLAGATGEGGKHSLQQGSLFCCN